jgi:hypothetical protein
MALGAELAVLTYLTVRWVRARVAAPVRVRD